MICTLCRKKCNTDGKTLWGKIVPEYVDCNLCGFNNTDTVQKAENPFKVVRCKECGLVYTNPQPDRKSIDNHYQEEYYKEWIEKQMEKRIHMWGKRLRELKEFKKEGCLLDVGCGVGTFLKLAKKEGFEVYGTEISEYACTYVKNRLKINIFSGDLEKAHFSPESFDIVTIWHTLEHLPNPLATLKEIHRILKKDGLLVVAVPNLNNYIVRILYLLAKSKRLLFFSGQAKEWHLYHFSNKTLMSMLKKAGFKIIKSDMDLAQITLVKKMIALLTFIFYLISKKNFGEAIKIYASKAK